MKYFVIKHLKLLSTLLIVTNQLGLSTEAPQDVKVKEQIAQLEEERSRLYEQIADALDSSVKDLQRSNDSDAKEGLYLVNDLKKKLKIFNNTENLNLNLSLLKSRRANDRSDVSAEIFGNNDEMYPIPEIDDRKALDDTKLTPVGGTSEESDRERIQLKESQDKVRKSIAKKSTFKPFKDKVFNHRYRSNRTWERYLKRLKIKQRVEEWLLKKAAEKEAIKKYRASRLNSSSGKERCPRLGIRDQSKKGGRKKKKFRGYYPCCRKCCKSSYLGCL